MENPQRVFIANGKSEYSVVYGGAETVKASSFLVGQLLNASDVSLKKIADSEVVSIGDEDKYIVIGCNDKFSAAGFSLEGLDLRTSGYAIRTKGNSVYIQANSAAGYQLGAISFLRHVVGYDMISSDMTIYTRKPETLPDMNISERPDFEYRYFTNCLSNTDQMYGQGFDDQIFINLNGKGTHNIFNALPMATYCNDEIPETYHPEWYAHESVPEKENQLCYTAHGNKESRQLMLETAYEVIKDAVESSPGKWNVQFSQQDNFISCSCEHCKTLSDRYGSPSASVLAFINDLDDMLRADIDAGNVAGRNPGEVVHIWMFAYYATLNPPKLPAGEALEDHAKYVRANRDVGVIYAPIEADFTQTFYDPINEREANLMTAWGEVTGNMMTWLYECNFHHYMYPYNSFDTIPDNYRFAKNNNVMIMYNQGIRQNTASTAFVRFREYLASKMQFDLRLTFKEVQKTFFENYFGDASDIMLSFYNEAMAWTNYLEQTHAELDGGIYEPIENVDYWPYAMLCGWMDKIDAAYAAVAKYETEDKERYDMLVNHIKLESIFPRYVLLKLHSSAYRGEVLKAERLQFKTDCEQFGITMDKELGSITSLWTQWGIS